MAAAARKVNWFAIWVSVAVVVVLVLVAVLVVTLNQSADDPGRGAAGGEHRLRDRRDPGRRRREHVRDLHRLHVPGLQPVRAALRPDIQKLVDDGTITLGIHPIAILDRQSQGTEYSTRAANAMYCVAVADGEAAVPFMQAMFANQPEEGSTGLTDDADPRDRVGVGVDGHRRLRQRRPVLAVRDRR